MTDCGIRFIHTVNCRIGSLEMIGIEEALDVVVNCRIGSLEKCTIYESIFSIVNCRIGSLENCRIATDSIIVR